MLQKVVFARRMENIASDISNFKPAVQSKVVGNSFNNLYILAYAQ